MRDCIFCKIIKGEIPSYKVYEDEHTYAFLDISQDTYGHTLVIPKVHCTNVLDCADDYLAHTISTVKKIANYYVDKCGFDGVNILNASGKAAEQSVFHLHFHILPRKNNDGKHTFPALGKEPTDLAQQLEVLKLN